MNFLKRYLILGCFIYAILIPCKVTAQTQSNARTEGEEKKVEVVLIIGKATYIKKGTTKSLPVVQGDLLSFGDRISTSKMSRIMLKLPDGSILRFDEQTTFELMSVEFDEKKQRRNIDVSMIMGKTWAKVNKFSGGQDRFTISTKTAIVGVRGTVYRVNVEEDNLVVVKVYWGEVLVNSPKKGNTSALINDGKLFKPSKVLGPHPIEGPHAVSVDEWTYIVKSMQQIVIKKDGTASKPFSFSPRDDTDDWVRWNQELDK